ncbi:MAG: hydrogenase [Verrucomicrobiales bacterium]|nr:hydrogenase [Verrucomicrobiales bacterium]
MSSMKSPVKNGVKDSGVTDEVRGQKVPSAWGNEFPEGAADWNEDFSRRKFIKLMGASMGLAGMGLLGVGCRRPEEVIMAFGEQPEGYVHGVAQYFATARPTRTGAVPIVVKSHEGRPTKIEGNERFYEEIDGQKFAGTDGQTQASILDLYDPDRARSHSAADGKQLSSEEALELLEELVKGNNKVAILTGQGTSPSCARMAANLGEKGIPVYSYEPIDDDILRRGAEKAFGQNVKPRYHLDKAATILSLDCDFIGSEADSHIHLRDFARGRKLRNGSMSRLYVAEPRMTPTGGSADHRLRVKASGVQAIARTILNLLGSADGKLDKDTENADWLNACAADLRDGGVVLVGHGQPVEVHVLAHAINEKIGAVGKAVDFLPAEESTAGSIADLAKASFDVLVVAGGNPAYNAPAEIDWAKLIKGKKVVRLGYYRDESAQGADLFLAQTHYLEEWGDAKTSSGNTLSVQPLIRPLFDGISELQLLAKLAGESKSAHEIVQETTGKSGDDWLKYLHDGFDADEKETVAVGSVTQSAAGSAAKPAEGLEVVFARDYSVDDGRFANNGWLQELPDPITKITWDNAVLVSRRTAEDQRLANGDRVTITLEGRSVDGHVWIQPGQADGTLALALGYGRDKDKFGGRVAVFDGKPIGFNAYAIRPGVAGFATGATVKKAGSGYNFACTQDHWSMEGRAIVREANLDGEHGFRKNPGFAGEVGLDSPGHASHTINPETGKPYEIYNHPYKERPSLKNAKIQWGMSIDLNSCVGCSACVIACQSENNIPIVGRDQVERGREMHWLRIDRYYTGFNHKPTEGDTAGDDEQEQEGWIDDPQVVNQPMLCQHCESAPCESVCPVNATVHDDEGINAMVYNRCIGTRYCSNNCAWKVRRFNFFDYNKRPLNALYKGPLASNEKDDPTGWDLVKMAKNPEVTVRMRGVMEKCTYCVQRIEDAKIAHKRKASQNYKDAVARGNEDVAVSSAIPDGGVRTACQQACSADAIVFGNMADPGSAVSQAKQSPRDYSVLGFLNTLPHTTYLARVRNPNLDVPGMDQPYSAREYESAAHGDHGHDDDHSHGEGAHDDHGKGEHK